MDWIQLAQYKDQWQALGNESSGSVAGWKFLDKLNNYQILKKDSAPWTMELVSRFFYFGLWNWQYSPPPKALQEPSHVSLELYKLPCSCTTEQSSTPELFWSHSINSIDQSP